MSRTMKFEIAELRAPEDVGAAPDNEAFPSVSFRTHRPRDDQETEDQPEGRVPTTVPACGGPALTHVARRRTRFPAGVGVASNRRQANAKHCSRAKHGGPQSSSESRSPGARRS